MAGFMTGVGDLFNYAFNSLDMTSSANDIIVIQHADGTMKASPFAVRFGKVKVLRPQDKVVTIEVNGMPTTAVMKIASDGTAYWVHPIDDPSSYGGTMDSPLESPLPASPVAGPQSPGSGGSSTGAGPHATPPIGSTPSGGLSGRTSALGIPPLDAGGVSPTAVGPDPPSAPSPLAAEATAPSAPKLLDEEDPVKLLHAAPGLLTSLAAEATTQPPTAGGASSDNVSPGTDAGGTKADDAATTTSGDEGDGGSAGGGGLRLARYASTDGLDQIALGHLTLPTTPEASMRAEAGGEGGDASDGSAEQQPSDGLAALQRAVHADPHGMEMLAAAAAAATTAEDEARAAAGQPKTPPPTIVSTTMDAAHAPTTASASGSAPLVDDEGMLDKFSDSDDDDVLSVDFGRGGTGASDDTGSATAGERAGSAAGTTGRRSAADGPVCRRSIVASPHDLARLNLRPGANTIRFSTGTTLRGHVSVTANIYLYSESAKLVISDVDGTVTKSDVMGHIATFFGKDWTHPGLCALYSRIARNGYHFVYLTARSVAQAEATRQFLQHVEQDGMRLPPGPVLTAPDKLFTAAIQELSKKSHEFKITCLAQLRDAFPLDVRPFYAGFGNRIGDVVAYTASGISQHKVFIINKDSVIHICSVKKSYRDLSHMVDETFPARRADDGYLAEFHEHRLAEAAFNAHALGARGLQPAVAPASTGGSHPALGASFDSDGLSPPDPAESFTMTTTTQHTPGQALRGTTEDGTTGTTVLVPMSSPTNMTAALAATASVAAGGALSPRAASTSVVGVPASVSTDPALKPKKRDVDPEFNDFNFWRIDPATLVETPKKPKKEEVAMAPTSGTAAGASASRGHTFPAQPPSGVGTAGGGGGTAGDDTGGPTSSAESAAKGSTQASPGKDAAVESPSSATGRGSWRLTGLFTKAPKK